MDVGVCPSILELAEAFYLERSLRRYSKLQFLDGIEIEKSERIQAIQVNNYFAILVEYLVHSEIPLTCLSYTG